MNEIKIKRNKLYFLVTISFTTILYWGMCYILLLEFFNQPIDHLLSSKGLETIAGCSLLFSLSIYTIVQYLKNSPTIIVDDKQISFNSTSYLWEEIETITLTGKQPYKYIINFPREGASFELKNGKLLYLYDHLYAGTGELKSFIKDIIIDKKEVVHSPSTVTGLEATEGKNTRIFKGNQFYTFRGISMWAVNIFCIYIMIKFSNAALTVLPFVALWSFICSRLMYYFSLSGKLLIIRNHNLFWIKHVYSLDNIEEIVFEIQVRGHIDSSCLRIITKDYEDKLYTAETLSEIDWNSLAKALKSKKIKVRNERKTGK